MTPTANLAASSSEPTLGAGSIGSPADAKSIFNKPMVDASGMAASQPSELRPVTTSQVGHVALQGSNTSGESNVFTNDVDHAADGSMDAIRNAPLSRYGVGQSAVGPHSPAPAPAVTLVPEEEG